MKKYFFIAVLFVLSACSSQPVIVQGNNTPPANPSVSVPKIVNVLDQSGRITAEVDTNTGTVKYYQSPEKSFEACFRAYMIYSSQVEKALHPAPAKAEDKKAEVKKEEKKPVTKKK